MKNIKIIGLIVVLIGVLYAVYSYILNNGIIAKVFHPDMPNLKWEEVKEKTVSVFDHFTLNSEDMICKSTGRVPDKVIKYNHRNSGILCGDKYFIFGWSSAGPMTFGPFDLKR